MFWWHAELPAARCTTRRWRNTCCDWLQAKPRSHFCLDLFTGFHTTCLFQSSTRYPALIITAVDVWRPWASSPVVSMSVQSAIGSVMWVTQGQTVTTECVTVLVLMSGFSHVSGSQRTLHKEQQLARSFTWLKGFYTRNPDDSPGIVRVHDIHPMLTCEYMVLHI